MEKKKTKSGYFEKFALKVTKATGSTPELSLHSA